MFFCYHGNINTMTPNFNILGVSSQSVLEITLNHLSIMNMKTATGQGREKCKIMAIFHCFSVTMTTK